MQNKIFQMPNKTFRIQEFVGTVSLILFLSKTWSLPLLHLGAIPLLTPGRINHKVKVTGLCSSREDMRMLPTFASKIKAQFGMGAD